MRKRLLYVFIVFCLIFGWIFLFCGTITTNNFSNTYKLYLKNNDTFKDLTYEKANEYDFKSTLMLRQDYFMQGLEPSNYAFIFGIKLGGWNGLSADKNDSNYWFKIFRENYRSYEITLNSQDISKGRQVKLILYDDSTGRFLVVRKKVEVL